MDKHSALIRRLATVYGGLEIQYPHLRPITLAQWLLESGRGTSGLAKEHYNFGGLKWRPEMKRYASRVRYGAHDGADYYCKFPTLEAFVRGYWAFINRAPYSGWEEHVDDAADYIGFIGPKYTPSKDYAKKVMRLLPEAQWLLDHTSLDGALRRDSGDGGHEKLIVIDPGHGGSKAAPGSSANNAISHSGVKEKALTLEFALMLEREIKAVDGSVGTVLTRRSDENVAGEKRAGFGRNADLFLSIHFNGWNQKARGTETYFRAQVNGNGHVAKDMHFAKVVNDTVVSAIGGLDGTPIDRGIKPDTETRAKRLAVLSRKILGDKPRACLVEIEFIDNKIVDHLIVSGPAAIANKAAIAKALARRLVRYLGEIA